MAKYAKLTEQQKKFCEEYASNGGFGEKAATAAGYKDSNACSMASRLLTNPLVTEYLKTLIDEIHDKRVAKVGEIQAFWTAIMRGSVMDDGYPPKLSDRIKASELLAKSQGVFIEKLQLSGANGESLPSINLNFVKPKQMGLFEED